MSMKCQQFTPLIVRTLFGIGYFRVPKTFTLKTRPSAKTSLVKMNFICIIVKNHFQKKGFAVDLVLKQRLAASRKPYARAFWRKERGDEMMKIFVLRFVSGIISKRYLKNIIISVIKTV